VHDVVKRRTPRTGSRRVALNDQQNSKEWIAPEIKPGAADISACSGSGSSRVVRIGHANLYTNHNQLGR